MPEVKTRYAVHQPAPGKASSEVVLGKRDEAEIEVRFPVPVTEYDEGAEEHLHMQVTQYGLIGLRHYTKIEWNIARREIVACVEGFRVGKTRLRLGSRSRKIDITLTRQDTGDTLFHHTLNIRREAQGRLRLFLKRGGSKWGFSFRLGRT